jgi:predicted phage tail protein
MRIVLRNVIATLLVIIMLGINAAALDVCVREKLKVKVIRGRIVAPWRNNEEPIPNAIVKILKWRDEAYQVVAEVTANEQGQFSIGNIPSGEYEIEARAMGLSPLQVGLKLSNPSESKWGKEIVMTLEPKVGGCPGWAEVRKTR